MSKRKQKKNKDKKHGFIVCFGIRTEKKGGGVVTVSDGNRPEVAHSAD